MAAETGIYHVVQKMVQILGYLKEFLLHFSLADGGAQTSVKKYFLRISGTVCCQR